MHNHCQNCINLKKCRLSNECPIVKCVLDCGWKFHECKLEEHKILCMNEQVPCLNKAYGCPMKLYRHRISAHLPSCPASVVQCTLRLNHWPVYFKEQEYPRDTTEEPMSDTNSTHLLNNSFLQVTVVSEIASAGLNAYDTQWEEFMPFRVNPSRPYTFACSQVFRRDEYNWHYKNIHNDIHYSLNGVIIQWCPLAQYGCSFSRKRLSPHPMGSRLVFNEVVGGFGVVPPPFNAVNGNCQGSQVGTDSNNVQEINDSSNRFCDTPDSGDMLSVLPFEILQRIAYNLDSFSLGNLALTSRYLRDVCNTLLEDRGVVVIQWAKDKTQENISKWQTLNYKWFFSKAIEPVSRWCYLEGNSLSDHIQACPFNERRQLKAEHVERCKLFDPDVLY